MSNKTFKPPDTANKTLLQNCYKYKLRFEGSCLKQEDTASFTSNKVVNLFIAYELDTWSRDLNAGFTLQDCLFGSVKITKNDRSLFSIPNFD